MDRTERRQIGSARRREVLSCPSSPTSWRSEDTPLCASSSGAPAAPWRSRGRPPCDTAATRPASRCARPTGRWSSWTAAPARTAWAWRSPRSAEQPVRGHLLITHTHWDHIQGFPFFAPLFVRGNEFDIYAPGGLGQQLEVTLAGQMEYTYFPITLAQCGAAIRFHDLSEGSFEIGTAARHRTVPEPSGARPRLPARGGRGGPRVRRGSRASRARSGRPRRRRRRRVARASRRSAARGVAGRRGSGHPRRAVHGGGVSRSG